MGATARGGRLARGWATCVLREQRDKRSHPRWEYRVKMLWKMCEAKETGDDHYQRRENHQLECGPAGSVDQAPAKCRLGAG